MRLALRFACLLCAGILASLPALAGGGAVVESVSRGGGGAKAGLRAGDRILTWSRGDRTGKVTSYFDWSFLLAEEQPRGGLVLRVRGEGGRREIELPNGALKVIVSPDLSGRDLQPFLEGRRLVEAKDVAGGAARWAALADGWESRGRWELACWLELRTAAAWQTGREWKKALAAMDRAVEASRRLGHPEAQFACLEGHALGYENAEQFDPASSELEALETFAKGVFGESLHLARAFHLRGFVAWRQGKWTEAEGHYLRALALRERMAPESADTAATVNNLGIVCDDLGGLEKAQAYYERALALKEKLEPEGISLGMTLNNLGIVLQRRGDYTGAERLFDRALALYQRLEPDGSHVAISLTNLGKLYREVGDLPRAEGALRRSLALKEKLSPGTQSHAASLLSLGVLCHNRGELAAAEECYLKAYEIRRRTDPLSARTAILLNNLGRLAEERKDLVTAEERYREAIAILDRAAPTSTEMSLLLNNLGVLVGRMGRMEESEAWHQRALALREAAAPDGLDTADSLINLSWMARERGDLQEAWDMASRALAIQDRAAPGNLYGGNTRIALAKVLVRRGDLVGAEAQALCALEVFSRLAPGTTREAEVWEFLGRIQRDLDRKAGAADSFYRAIDALEFQRDRLGGSEDARAAFSAEYIDYYRDLIGLLLDLGRTREAYAVLERSRARGLLALLALRDLVFAGEIPDEMERERRDLAARHDRALAELSRISDQDGAEALEAARKRLDAVRRDREALGERIARASPHLAALRYPVPLDLEGAVGVMDPGTLFLAYVVGEEDSALFALGPGPSEFLAVKLPFGEKRLGFEVRRVLRFLADRVDPRPLVTALSLKLLGPVAEKVGRAERVVVSPDGPLHLLPFAALAHPARSGGFRYLGGALPLSTVLSVTLHAELARGRGEPRDPALAAFGDPAYPPPEDSRSRVRGGALLTPLPGTRAEVEEIGRLFPGRSRVLLREEATEEAAKALGSDPSLVHFACHGILDGQFPLDSALALSFPARPGGAGGNGLLQAWEVFESVRIDADLVTLSACDTGLGRNLGGEGLVGLTRAFQFAGASTVLATLWKVPDEASAALMVRFYAQLRAGLAKDEALRLAQSEFLAGPVDVALPEGGIARMDLSHPFFWAGYLLLGDWK